MPKAKKNSVLFRDEYWEHAGVSRVFYERCIRGGVAESAGRRAITLRQRLQRMTFDEMRDLEGLEPLRALKLRRYRELEGPSWDYLYQEALSSGKGPEGAAIAVLEWLIRTHGPPVDEQNRWYKAVLRPSERFKALKDTSLAWSSTDNPEEPWFCQHGASNLSIRLGDFPIEHLYHVYSGDERLGVVDDWPPLWSREAWPSK